MKFRTEYQPAKASLTLTPERPVILLGSCFSDNIASKMRDSLWKAVNPAGTLYNPESIAKTLEVLLSPDDLPDKVTPTLRQDARGTWHSFLFDSRISSKSPEECVAKAIDASSSLLRNLSEAQALFVTFGTAIYYNIDLPEENNFTVSNCHKFPADLFTRARLSVSQIVERWCPLCRRLRQLFPRLHIVFTVSPVRHIKDGFEANARSKAILLLATEEICRRLPYCSYFPAYEILNDDLRDYRFYATDLAHPSEQAVDYIFEIFKETYLDSTGLQLLKEGDRLMRAYRHRPLIASDHERAAYREETAGRIKDFLLQHPMMLNPLEEDL